MISVEEAKKIIESNFTGQRVSELKLLDACGLILAEDVVSPIDFPPFNQSAMDGFAFSFDLWDKKSPLKIIGESQAGTNPRLQIKSNQSIRIYTGSVIPEGADTIVIRENVSIEDDTIIINDAAIKKGLNCRPKASQCKKGDIVLNKGSQIHAAGVSFLAGIGISKLKVFDKPTVSIICTGKELEKDEIELTEGKIYESNSIGLAAALNQCGIIPKSINWVDDVPEQIEQLIKENLNVDLLILTGGVSVGDYDFVPAALANCGVEKLFHKVKQKPGKPIYFGKKNQTLIFGLPGNPAAVMTCFYQYILPLISMFTAREYRSYKILKLEKAFSKKPGLTHFLKGKATGEKVRILSGQESYLMNSFAYANCLVELTEITEYLNEGDEVKIYFFDSMN